MTLSENVFKSFDSLEISARNKDVIDWLVAKFDLPAYEHSFKDKFILTNIWNGRISISVDKRVPEQVALFNSIPDNYKGTPQYQTGKIVNKDTLYFNLNNEFEIPYPKILSSKIIIKQKHKDDDNDIFYTYDHELKLSDGTFAIYHNQSEKMDISTVTLNSMIQQRFFYNKFQTS